MKSHVAFSLIVVVIFAVSGVVGAQTEQPAETATPKTSVPEGMGMRDLPAMLEQMAQTLAQANVTPDMLKQTADRMKQMADQMKQMPGMPENAQKMPMMPMMMDCQKMMPMMQKMMENMSGMMDMKPKMTPDKPMMQMDPMMSMMMPQMMGMKPEPKAMGRMMEMRGEMMKAMGDIMLKYGKLMFAEATPEGSIQSVANIEQSTKTATYAVSLKIGPFEKMLTLAEAKTAKEGEVMTSGKMVMDMPEMPLTHHVEVRVQDNKSGAVVTNQALSINVTNDATKKTTDVPVATMYGLDEGVADTHFGNNAALPPGEYTIVVTVGKETATFHVTLPAS